MAPEVLRQKPHDQRADIWAYACVAECMVTHEMVYHAHGALQEGNDDQALIDRVERGTLRPAADGHFLEYLILDIARDDPRDRPQFPEIIMRLDKLHAGAAAADAKVAAAAAHAEAEAAAEAGAEASVVTAKRRHASLAAAAAEGHHHAAAA